MNEDSIKGRSCL